jgi:polyphosphate kinase
LRYRNLDNRLETIFPVVSPHLRRRLVEVLRTYFADNVKARELLPDGTYRPVERSSPEVRAQEHFYREAAEMVQAAGQSALRFQPLTRPKE